MRITTLTEGISEAAEKSNELWIMLIPSVSVGLSFVVSGGSGAVVRFSRKMFGKFSRWFFKCFLRRLFRGFCRRLCRRFFRWSYVVLRVVSCGSNLLISCTLRQTVSRQTDGVTLLIWFLYVALFCIYYHMIFAFGCSALARHAKRLYMLLFLLHSSGLRCYFLWKLFKPNIFAYWIPHMVRTDSWSSCSI